MMSAENKKCCGQCVVRAFAILGTFFIVGWLVCQMVKYTRPAPIGQERAQERSKTLTDVRAADTQALNSYGWQDQAKGIVRLPIQRAKELALQEGKDAATARKELLSRLDKATALPPKAPEKPSQFE